MTNRLLIGEHAESIRDNKKFGDFRKCTSLENFLFTTPGTSCWLAVLPSAAPPATPSLLRAIQGVGLLIFIWLAAGGGPLGAGSPSRLFFFSSLLTGRLGNPLEDQMPAQFLSGRCECVRARHNPYLTGSMKGPFRVAPPSRWDAPPSLAVNHLFRSPVLPSSSADGGPARRKAHRRCFLTPSVLQRPHSCLVSAQTADLRLGLHGEAHV